MRHTRERPTGATPETHPLLFRFRGWVRGCALRQGFWGDVFIHLKGHPGDFAGSPFLGNDPFGCGAVDDGDCRPKQGRALLRIFFGEGQTRLFNRRFYFGSDGAIALPVFAGLPLPLER